MTNNDPYSYDTETTEYKTGIPYRRELARDIAAFANTKGGQIYIGYIPGEEGLINLTGLTNELVQEAEQKVRDALRYLRPKPSIDIIEDTTLGNKQFVVISVQKNATPVLFGERYYLRRGNKTTIAEEDLIDALSESVPSIKPNILQTLQTRGIAAEEINATNVVSGLQYIGQEVIHVGKGNISTQVIRETIEEKSNLDLTKLLKESIQHTRDDLTVQRRERFQQARIAFIVALITLVLALIFVSVGAILIFTINIQGGVVSSVVSIVSGIFSGMSFTFYKQTNDRMDEDAKELIALEKSYTAMQYISYITDVKVKDEAIHELAKSISIGNQANK